MRGERMWGDGGASSAQGWARLQIGSRARGGAHGEHVKHVCDAGGVAKLSGWLNADAYCRESNGGHTMRDEVRARRREGGGRPRCKQGAGERARLQIGGRARGRAHEEHPIHDYNSRQSQKDGIRCGVSCCRSAGAGGWQAAAVQATCRGELDCRLRHGEERT